MVTWYSEVGDKRTLVQIKTKIKINQLRMNQQIIDTIYKGVGIVVILIVTITTIVGTVKMWNQIRNIKDKE